MIEPSGRVPSQLLSPSHIRFLQENERDMTRESKPWAWPAGSMSKSVGGIGMTDRPSLRPSRNTWSPSGVKPSTWSQPVGVYKIATRDSSWNATGRFGHGLDSPPDVAVYRMPTAPDQVKCLIALGCQGLRLGLVETGSRGRHPSDGDREPVVRVLVSISYRKKYMMFF